MFSCRFYRAVIHLQTQRVIIIFVAVSESNLAQLFIYKLQTFLKASDKFAFFFFNFDLYATSSLCPEVKIDMTVIYQMQNKINV